MRFQVLAALVNWSVARTTQLTLTLLYVMVKHVFLDADINYFVRLAKMPPQCMRAPSVRHCVEFNSVRLANQNVGTNCNV